MVLYGPPWTLIVPHVDVWFSIVQQFPGRLAMKSNGFQLLIWSAMFPYKHLGSPTVHFCLQKGQNKKKRKQSKNLKWKKLIYKNVVKFFLFCMNLCTYAQNLRMLVQKCHQGLDDFYSFH